MMVAQASRRGITLIEVLIVIATIGLLVSLSVPAIQFAREAARCTQCTSNLRQIGVALHAYHDRALRLPPAMIWEPPGDPLAGGIAPPGVIDRISLGKEPDRVFANWVVLLLPELEEQPLYDLIDRRVPLGDARNEQVWSQDLPIFKCPSDALNGADAHFQRAEGLVANDQGYARGNYALNTGTNERCLMRLAKNNKPLGSCTDGYQVDGSDLMVNTRQVWGSGLGGINRSISFREIPHGLSRVVAVEEIRAGIGPGDRRGVWALGFVGSSLTAAHGRSGNKGPNAGSDYIQGCRGLKTTPGEAALSQAGLPCSSAGNALTDFSVQATARSDHLAGVNVLMADGSVHFVRDEVDMEIWHTIHRRVNMTPAEMAF